jgi:hypothetical protein
MTTQILNFKKTEHFMLRQWERGIDDRTIRLALQHVTPNYSQLIVLNMPFFIRYGLKFDGRSVLIKVDKNRLVTIFSREHFTLKKYLNKQNIKQPVQFIF